MRGAKEMAARIRRLAERFPDAIEGALRIEGELVMTDSKKNYVPVDEGVLKNSGFVDDPERKGVEVSVTLGFGGAASAYALAVHEHPSRHSPPSWRNVRDERGRFRAVQFHPRGRGPKYLEKPLMNAVPGMANRIGKRLGDRLKSRS
jgi:hypothetical protein